MNLKWDSKTSAWMVLRKVISTAIVDPQEISPGLEHSKADNLISMASKSFVQKWTNAMNCLHSEHEIEFEDFPCALDWKKLLDPNSKTARKCRSSYGEPKHRTRSPFGTGQTSARMAQNWFAKAWVNNAEDDFFMKALSIKFPGKIEESLKITQTCNQFQASKVGKKSVWYNYRSFWTKWWFHMCMEFQVIKNKRY